MKHINNPYKPQIQLDLSSPKILIIEDDLTSLKPIVAILKNLGCEIFPAFSIDDAINWLKRTPIDLLILDWFLPQNDGKETLKGLNAFLNHHPHRQIKKIPYVTYSGLEELFIPLPEDQNFIFINHWQKPLPLPLLTKKTLNILHKL